MKKKWKMRTKFWPGNIKRSHFQRFRHELVDNIKTDPRILGLECEYEDGTKLSPKTNLGLTSLNIQLNFGFQKCIEFLDSVILHLKKFLYRRTCFLSTVTFISDITFRNPQFFSGKKKRSFL
jgi:hypothetical protein